MEIFNNLLDEAVVYFEMAMDYALQNLLTIEGIIGLLFFSFLVGLISKIRS